MTFSKNDCVTSDHLKSQLSRLNRELISYQIIDRQGISRAEVRDVYYDANNELNLLINITEIDDKISLRRLEYQDICKIDLANKLVFSNLSYQEIENLPLYQSVPVHLKKALQEYPLYNDCEMNPAHNNYKEQSTEPEVDQIPLLEEQLEVTKHRQKVGEVIVRKQVETRIVQVPLRREKLIVERIGKDPEKLTEVVIGEGKIGGFKYEELNDNNSLHITKSSFFDLSTAQELLEALAHLSSAANTKVRLEIVTNCSEHQVEHQDICGLYQNS
ncbi:MAG: YsnF/AvaK domain-containing protein [Xenococcaceae cyanobacterium]